MRLVTAKEMQEIDRRAIKEFGIPGLVLMENAGRSVAQAVAQKLGRIAGKRIVILCGKGNNGGDGFVAARHLLQKGATVKVFLACEPEDITGDARVNFTILERLGQEVFRLSGANSIQLLKVALMQAEAVVDALYGTGFRGKMPDRLGKVVEAVNDAGRFVVAVDVPSGLNADTGQVSGPCVQANLTVTFGLPKVGLVLEPGAGYAGELMVADISLPQDLTDTAGPGRYLVTRELVASWVAPRPVSAHKGSFGRVVVIGGSRGMLGAVCLAASAALRSGAGLVTLGVPLSLQDVAAAKLTEVITCGLPETPEGCLSRTAYPAVMDLLKGSTVCALGPGMSQNANTVVLIRELVKTVSVPVVLDADGLNAFAGEGALLGERVSPLIITPHPGEMARLRATDVAAVQADRLETAERAAREWGAVVVLKGARTVVADPGGYTGVNSTGNPGMATAGTGDVLTGVIAAMVAQGMEPFRAAGAAVYLHGRAGDIAVREKGQMSLVAGDVLAALPEACREVEGIKER